MLARLRTLQPPNHYAALLPLNVVPSQIAEFADAQTVIKGEPDSGSVACAMPVSACGLAQPSELLALQMLAKSALFVDHTRWPELVPFSTFVDAASTTRETADCLACSGACSITT